MPAAGAVEARVVGQGTCQQSVNLLAGFLLFPPSGDGEGYLGAEAPRSGLT